ncbi:UNVERIFIED_CONTAM: hypothetical protein RMT77_000026 [Armadillidium vulgare]
MATFVAIVILGILFQAKEIICQNGEEAFSPNIEPMCSAGFMNIKVNVNTPYHGVIYTQGHREAPCMIKGQGRTSVTLRLPLITDEDKPDYCGIRVNKTTKEKYVHVFVRFHEILELADDKMYKIRCGRAGYTTRNETNYVDFALLDPFYKPSSTAVFDKKYILRGRILGPDRTHVMRIRECLAFDEGNVSLSLTDTYGCPIDNSIEPFIYNDTQGTAQSTIDHMFKFQDSNRVNFQCDVYICPAPCKEDYSCASRPERLIEANSQEGRALPGSSNSLTEEGRIQAGTSVYVVPPGSDGVDKECEYYPPWLWILCIALAVLFIIMMIINIFLCSAMTCSCTKTEVIEKEPSIIEEYDPYRSWHGSQYGSRYSLNGKGYTSGASTMNSARSVSSHSDHYAIVHSRPDSRYSGHHSLRDPRIYKSPPSTTGSHYSNRI